MTAPCKKDLISLLGAVTDELGIMSFEMVEFGEILSTDNPFGDPRTYRQKMQALELLSEKIMFCVSLLSLAAKAMEDDSARTFGQIKTAIANATFPRVRDRLTFAVDGSARSPACTRHSPHRGASHT